MEDVSLTVSLQVMCDYDTEGFDTPLVCETVAESKAPHLACLTITSITLPLLFNTALGSWRAPLCLLSNLNAC